MASEAVARAAHLCGSKSLPLLGLAACPVCLLPGQLAVGHESPIRHGPCSSRDSHPTGPAGLALGWGRGWGGRDGELAHQKGWATEAGSERAHPTSLVFLSPGAEWGDIGKSVQEGPPNSCGCGAEEWAGSRPM